MKITRTRKTNRNAVHRGTRRMHLRRLLRRTSRPVRSYSSLKDHFSYSIGRASPSSLGGGSACAGCQSAWPAHPRDRRYSCTHTRNCRVRALVAALMPAVIVVLPVPSLSLPHARVLKAARAGYVLTTPEPPSGRKSTNVVKETERVESMFVV